MTPEEKQAAIDAALKKRGAKVQNIDSKAQDHAAALKSEKEKRGAKKPKVHGTEKLYWGTIPRVVFLSLVKHIPDEYLKTGSIREIIPDEYLMKVQCQ